MADVALEVFGRMRRDGFKPRKSTYNSLLEACASAPQPRAEQAFEIYHAMVADGAIAPGGGRSSCSWPGVRRRFSDAFDAMPGRVTRDGRDVVGLDVYLSVHPCASMRRAFGGPRARSSSNGSVLVRLQGGGGRRRRGRARSGAAVTALAGRWEDALDPRRFNPRGRPGRRGKQSSLSPDGNARGVSRSR